MASTDPGAKSVEFKNSWKESFPGDPVPRLTCFENSESGSGQSAFRKSLQVTLDYHNMRISQLQKKLTQEQFILEFVARELEQLPVPREAGTGSPINQSMKPTPRPRKPPAVPKKPNSSVGEDSSHPAGLRRNHSTPSPRHTSMEEKKFQYSSSVYTPMTHSLEQSTSQFEKASNFEIDNVKKADADVTESDPAGDRFKSFQGTTFGSFRSPLPRILDSCSVVDNAVSNPVTGSPAIIPSTSAVMDAPAVMDTPAVVDTPPNSDSPTVTETQNNSDYETIPDTQVFRNSMKRMDRFSINESESSSSSSSQDDVSSNYMQLWTNKPLAEVERTSSSVSSEGAVNPLEETQDDSSAASIRSSSDKSSFRKKSSRMVRVDYGSKNGPQAIRDESIDNTAADDYDSDQEDDNPQYVRLVYKAHSVATYMHIGDTDSVNSGASLDSSDTPPAIGSEAKATGTETPQNSSTSSTRHTFQMQESVGGDEKTRAEQDNENLQMRNWVVNSVLESEKSYIDDLNVLIQYKKSLELAAQTSVPMISTSDISSIFGNLQEIHEIHSMFRTNLEPIIAGWTHHSEVGHLFKEMAVNLQHYNNYLENYPKAISTVKRCCQENPAFDNLVKLIKCPSDREMHHLEALLHKPINRMQRNSLVLQDLIKCTPFTHPDHKMFQNALKLSQHFLRDEMKISSTGNDKTALHVLVKNQLLVEYVGGRARKLRHVFLFNDLLVCTKCMIVKGKHLYEVKWFLPLVELQLSDKMDDTPVEWKQRAAKAEKEIQSMKAKLKEHKAQLRRELKECKNKNIEISGNYKIIRLTKRIQEQEANLILAEPRLRFTISARKGANYCFLLPSDYERREWQESIQALKSKLPAESKLKLSHIDSQAIIDACKDNVQLNNMGQMVMKEATDEDIMSGQLTVTIHKILGLQSSCETFTAIEVDSFGHFYLKAKTSIIESEQPAWNESFAVDLESSSTLRLLCYKHTSSGDVLLGKCPLNLSKQWLKQGFQEKELSMNEVTLTVSIRYQTAEQTIRRMPSHVESGVFGVRLSGTCNKEGLKVPAFVTACIEDVEQRGIDEMGIYRVSGTTSDVQRIRKAFDKSARIGKQLLPDVEINAVTGALKLYFRELPEALITDALYPAVIEAYKIQDKDEQQKKMVALLGSLPDSNYYTMMAVLEHLVRVGNHESSNKMPFHNLAVVFGPTLLKPAVKEQNANPMDLFSSGANDAMYQSGILFYYLTLLSRGTKFR